MAEEPTAQETPVAATVQRDAEGKPITVVVERAGRFSREFTATLISVLITALGVVVALAWNAALTAYFQRFLGPDARVWALFIYAVGITLLAVLAIIVAGKLARRIGSRPVEFKFPADEKKD
jgi:hypothetical protein